VTSIGAYAFADRRGLSIIKIPYGVTSIGACAFYDCSGLSGMKIPNSVTSIGNLASGGCFEKEKKENSPCRCESSSPISG
jgi:hypothetical protein